jgi:hypothetical protein
VSLCLRQVQEYYGDYIAINADLFTLNVERPLILATNRCGTERRVISARFTDIPPGLRSGGRGGMFP